MAYEGMIAETIPINGNNSGPVLACVARPHRDPAFTT